MCLLGERAATRRSFSRSLYTHIYIYVYIYMYSHTHIYIYGAFDHGSVSGRGTQIPELGGP